ncbi:hypothetical protein EVAR_23416_1 [Eumeta japonica]|uniref:ZAD domain-containing protein n=1 Tax=Eumeta variegata TaxID=151549 RepID=A0A4C1VY67_EUMVA|nr:hypothetical protein EVAR_23416_1 [Eumeta japonica]
MSSELKLDEGLCRCCHAQGMFQNLSTPFVCQGQEEIYSEMLRECFNVVITPLEGEYSTSTYTICITCALKLRDANEFKKQVLECEERFKEVCKEVMKSLEPMDIDIKLEIDITGDQSIKEEPSYDDTDTGAEENCDVKSEDPKDDLDTTIKRTQIDVSKGKGRKLRVTSNKGKPAVKVKRQNRISISRRQKKGSSDNATNETDSTKNKAATVTGTRKKIADKKTLADKSYKKEHVPLTGTDDSRTEQYLVNTAGEVVLSNQAISNSFSPEPLHVDEHYHLEE